MGKKISLEVEKKVIEMYLMGEEIKDIWEENNIADTTIWKILNRNNIKHRTLNMKNNNIKYCFMCKDILIINENWNIKLKKYKQYICKECYPKYSEKKTLKSVYGITKDEYVFLLEKVNNRCEICGSNIKLCIDHDHETDRIRGILCGNCNSAIGLFKENIKSLLKAVEYLKRNVNIIT